MYTYNNIELHWLGHDAFYIKTDALHIYIDPYKITKKDLPMADIIITTHHHFDHTNPEDIEKLANEHTTLIGPEIAQDALQKIKHKQQVLELAPSQHLEVKGIKLTAIPAYNTHRFREPGKPFHPKEEGHLGPILDIAGTKIYHSGDTDKIPEMDGLAPDIALIPVSGTYVMDVAEAVEAANAINAKITIPMHVGRGIGKLEYATALKAKFSGHVEVLDLEE